MKIMDYVKVGAGLTLGYTIVKGVSPIASAAMMYLAKQIYHSEIYNDDDRKKMRRILKQIGIDVSQCGFEKQPTNTIRPIGFRAE